VNWMTAGSGIVHSERSPTDDRTKGVRLHGIQSWVALPLAHERVEATFSHHARETLPVINAPGVRLAIIAGHLDGQRAPTQTYSDMFYAAAELDGGASYTLRAEHEQRGIYIVEGGITLNGNAVPAQHLAVIIDASIVEIHAKTPARLMLLGGAKMDGDRHIW